MHAAQLIPPLFSFLATLLGIFLMLRFFPKWRFLDHPREYGLKRTPIPYSGGIIFFIVSLAAVFLFVDVTKQIAGVIFAAILITFVSFIDDRVKLSPWLRLFAQGAAGAIVVFAGVKIQLINNPFGAPLMLDSVEFAFLGEKLWVFSALAIIVWLVFMMNVMNWLDGIAGLSSGVSTIAQISLFILATRQFNVVDQSAVIVISSVLAASTFAFLLFDFPPPKILMGDTGSMFLGFMLGILSILAGGKLATALLIMGFPILDAFWVILKRIIKGVSPMKGDFSHFHHRLLRVGLSERKALFLNYFFCALFAAIALLLHSALMKSLSFLGIFIIMLLIGLAMVIKSKLLTK